ncbi:MAG TPA: hypothetical protein VM370_10315 [Candidatus Thermoplasmatota archaeon]|nr:hypothetical protein [Candidatus Thermoplasmatota archaeon]
MNDNRTVFRLTVRASEVPAFLGACEASEWYAMDTGERVMTDEGPDAEAVLLVEPVPRTAVHARAAIVA